MDADGAAMTERSGNTSVKPSFSEQWKKAMIGHYRDLGFTHALTLSWNRSVSLERAKFNLKLAHGIVDERLLGQRYNKKPHDQRTLAVFVFEGLELGGHVHAHSLWRIRKREHLIPFARLFPDQRGGFWNEIVPSGSYDLDLIDDPDAFAGYALKGWSQDFLRP
jgi:hypothetical protein